VRELLLVLLLAGCSRENTANNPPPTAPAPSVASTPLASAPSAPATATSNNPPSAIGEATMRDDKTIVMDLYQPAHARFVYPPSHPEYEKVLAHIGGLEPGQKKLVPPWPDDIDDARVEKSVHAYIHDKLGWDKATYRISITGTDADGNIAVTAIHPADGGAPNPGGGVSLRLSVKSYEVVKELPFH
jgi:hypothetical protein